MNLSRSTEVVSCNHCSGGKPTSITYYECVSVALVILHAMRTSFVRNISHSKRNWARCDQRSLLVFM